MTPYLDASVIVPLFAWEARSLPLRQWIMTLRERPGVGRLAVIEVGSALSRKYRLAQIDDLQFRSALNAFDTWLNVAANIIEHDPRDMADAARLVQRPTPKLLPADAIHLATARRLGVTLVTDDGGLQEVAALNRVDWISPT